MGANEDRELELRLKTNNFDAAARAVLGLTTNAAIAARLRVHPTVLSSMRTGRRPCNAAFVAACKTEMPHVSMDHLFEAVPAEATT